MKFYYTVKDDFFVWLPHGGTNLCCLQMTQLWQSGEYTLEVYKNGIRFFPYGDRSTNYRIFKECPYCHEKIETEKVKDTGIKFCELYPLPSRYYR